MDRSIGLVVHKGPGAAFSSVVVSTLDSGGRRASQAGGQGPHTFRVGGRTFGSGHVGASSSGLPYSGAATSGGPPRPGGHDPWGRHIPRGRHIRVRPRPEWSP